jgi:hypothetical protein
MYWRYDTSGNPCKSLLPPGNIVTVAVRRHRADRTASMQRPNKSPPPSAATAGEGPVPQERTRTSAGESRQRAGGITRREANERRDRSTLSGPVVHVTVGERWDSLPMGMESRERRDFINLQHDSRQSPGAEDARVGAVGKPYRYECRAPLALRRRCANRGSRAALTR